MKFFTSILPTTNNFGYKKTYKIIKTNKLTKYQRYRSYAVYIDFFVINSFVYFIVYTHTFL